MKNFLVSLTLLFCSNLVLLQSKTIYFPPVNSENWERIDPSDLNWNEHKINELYDFLDKSNTKVFLLLIDGKIAIEKYYDNFTKDSLWYWASAGKTLTASLVGIAQADSLLDINDRTSKYLGEGWTSMPKDKEDLITIRHQLTMTTGLDFNIEDLDCTSPDCLKYKADAGTQWFYHNAPYTLLEKVVEKATNQNFNIYTSQKIRNQIGMNGAWIKLGYNNVYFSNARSMARFGILILNNGYWEEKNIIKDKDYLNQMINTSQNLNKSYGYLWWLNGKESFMIPGSTMVFNSMLMPDSPADVFAALGKDGQCLNISPEKGIIWVRMGEKPDNQFFISTNYSNDIWKYLKQIMVVTNKYDDKNDSKDISLNYYANDYIDITFNNLSQINNTSTIKIYNTYGDCVMNTEIEHLSASLRINITLLPAGLYFIRTGNKINKFFVVR